MNKNTEAYFARVPSIDIPRSIFDLSFSHKTSGNVGDLIPVFFKEVLPGDTWRIESSKVIRLQTMLTPILDNIYAEMAYFYVPNDIIFDHWNEFCGENTQSAWIPSTEYAIPKIKTPTGGWNVGTIADYLGIPPGVEVKSGDNLISALPFRAVAKVADEWFRDQNLSDPLNIPTGDSTQNGSNGSNYINDVANGGMPFKVSKFHDRFSSCLPNSQKGAAVTIPGLNITIPAASLPVQTFKNYWSFDKTGTYPMSGYAGIGDADGNWIEDTAQGSLNHRFGLQRMNNNQVAMEDVPVPATTSSGGWFIPNNLKVDYPGFTGSVSPVTINSLRLAFATQQYLERLANGSRYVEILRNFFGVIPDDGRLGRSEFLGAHRVSVQVHQVTNTSQSENDFLGDLGAMSVTTNKNFDLEHSFTSHGILLGFLYLRYDHSYAQGVEPYWFRNSFLDFYNPMFANIGSQPVMSREIYWNKDNDDVFGYNEAWSEYRFSENRVSGEMRPGVANSLASWHLSDYYTTQPTLSDGWIREDKSNVDRVLAVTSANANQFFADFYFKTIVTRAMPMFSIPGLDKL